MSKHLSETEKKSNVIQLSKKRKLDSSFTNQVNEIDLLVSFKPSGSDDVTEETLTSATFFLPKEKHPFDNLCQFKSSEESVREDFLNLIDGQSSKKTSLVKADGSVSRRSESRISIGRRDIELCGLTNKSKQVSSFSILPNDVSGRGLGFFTDRKLKKGEKVIVCVGYRYIHGRVVYITPVKTADEARIPKDVSSEFLYSVGMMCDDIHIDLKSLFLIQGLLD